MTPTDQERGSRPPLPRRLVRAVRERGIGEVVRVVSHRVRAALHQHEEHLWYELRLDVDLPRRQLPAGYELTVAGQGERAIASAMEGGPSTEQVAAFTDAGGALWIVLDGRQAAFTCWIFPRVTPAVAARGGWLELPPGVVCLEDSATSPDHRGKGVAPAAWSGIAEVLRARGVQAITTKVAVDNGPSRRAVAKAGFVEVAVMRLTRVGPRTRVVVSPGGPGLSAQLAERLQR